MLDVFTRPQYVLVRARKSFDESLGSNAVWVSSLHDVRLHRNFPSPVLGSFGNEVVSPKKSHFKKFIPRPFFQQKLQDDIVCRVTSPTSRTAGTRIRAVFDLCAQIVEHERSQRFYLQLAIFLVDFPVYSRVGKASSVADYWTSIRGIPKYIIHIILYTTIPP